MRIGVLWLAAAAAVAMAAPAGSTPGGTALSVRSTTYGPILFDGHRRALYAFTRDRRNGPSTCYGACARAWPVYFAPKQLRAGRGVRPSLIGTTPRRGGRRQVTYAGRPLYYYVDDGAGQVKCQAVTEFGGTWLVVRPSGSLVR